MSCSLYIENKLTKIPDIKKYYEEVGKDSFLGKTTNSETNYIYNCGVYFYFIEKNYKEAEKYYLMAIENGNSTAMYCLGYYYNHIEKNYEEAKKYYLMAIENGNSDAMNCLGFYYHYYIEEKNYEEAKKYYLMAIENGNSTAMYNLGMYYHTIENNYEEAVKYYLMAIENGDSEAIINMTEIKENTSQIERYIIYKKNNITFNEVLLRETNIFINRLKYSYVMECPVCMDTINCIQLECCHYICYSCYPKILKDKKCHICRIDINS